MEEKIIELYKNLYDINIELLELKKKDVNKSKINSSISVFKAFILHYIPILIICIGFFMSFLLYFYIGLLYSLLPFLASFIICLILIFNGKYNSYIFHADRIQPYYMIGVDNTAEDEYINIIYEQICKPIIENVIPNIQYEHKNGISKKLYESMGFSNTHSLYYSTDNIKIYNENNLLISKVHTKFYEKANHTLKSYTAKDYYYETLFCGIVSINTLHFSIPFKIRIRNKSLESLKLKHKVKLNNAEFNKYYELETDNIDLFIKYFNDNILDYFVNLAKDKQNLEVNIFQNHIFIRLHDKNFLELNIKKKILKKY